VFSQLSVECDDCNHHHWKFDKDCNITIVKQAETILLFFHFFVLLDLFGVESPLISIKEG
jgi:hypothetical protein